MKIFTFDTTLRDGSQGESISFSVDDKLLIAQKLDELGIDYIEGGWPGSNPKDKEFFARAASELKLKHARLTAFGATRFARHTVEEDRSVQSLIAAETPVVSIFGKSWDLHTSRALGITEEENLKLISETVKYLKDHGKEVVYDAEHFFDGYNSNPASRYALSKPPATPGPMFFAFAIPTVERLPAASPKSSPTSASASTAYWASTLTTIPTSRWPIPWPRSRPATHVQGCINGYGERCGNANLCSIIANLELKLGHTVIGQDKLIGLANVSRFVAELANLPLPNNQPFVGHSAFAHKGGVHVSAVLKESATYEHVSPEAVGNHQRVLISDLSGRGNVLYKLKQHGLADRLTEDSRRELLERIKQMEYEGYELEAAEGTFELLVREVAFSRHAFLRSGSLRSRQPRPAVG